MYTVFVTGPLASGKRSACSYLAEHGFAHIDLDDMGKEFLEDELVQQQLLEAYGPEIIDSEGSIDKSALARLAFADASSTAALNSIIWPLIGERLADLIVGQSCQQAQIEEKLVVEAAMLAEAQWCLDLADSIICIDADEDTRIKRAQARGMDLEDIKNRMALQATAAARAQICDVVIENNGSLEALYDKLEAWLLLQYQEHLF